MTLTIVKGFFLGIWHSMQSIFAIHQLQKNILTMETNRLRRENKYKIINNISQTPQPARHRSLVTLQKQQQQSASSSSINNTSGVGGGGGNVNNRNVPTTMQSNRLNFYEQGILKPIFRIWCENIKYLLIPLLVLGIVVPYIVRSFLNSFLPLEDVNFICDVGNAAFYLLWIGPCIVVMEIVNLVHIKKISGMIMSLRREKYHGNGTATTGNIPSSSSLSSSSASATSTTTATDDETKALIESFFVNRLFVPLFLIVFNFQGIVLGNVGSFFFGFYAKKLIVFIHSSLLYSYYVFDYYWLDTGKEFAVRVQRMCVAWPYFLGFGLPMGLFQVIWPETVSFGVIALNIAYPLLLISAYLVSWTSIKHRVTLTDAYLNIPISQIYQPSFWLTNHLMNFLYHWLPRLRRIF